MNLIKYISIILIITSCASNNKYEDEIKQLKEQINKLSKEKESKNEDIKKKKKEVKNTESKVNLLEYKNNPDQLEEKMTHKIKLGKNYGVNYTLYITNRGTFWLNLSRVENVESITLFIPHKNKSPEFLNFIQINEKVYETKADLFQEKTQFQLTIKIKNKKNIVYNLEASP